MIHFKDRRLVAFGANAKKIRESKGISQNDIAQGTSLTKSDVEAIEMGRKNFAFTTLLELARGLGESPANMLDIELEI
ncbi:helix-turn-helix domain-containing protein [Flavobacterium macacae]|uniref:XRE family transcriptional regulator n=1 Tax=Flavobacterium macacae TaxID=2488993 RepID=A0A3P3VZ06_9FLAO|nr:helix-turn-helix transcriptional regulator [Flavobacterium macacae]RRJ88025.1 XRE family transcriptional regulator [Flavobacterium macacae]